MDGPGLEAKAARSRTPEKGEAAGGGRGAGTGKEFEFDEAVVGEGGGMVRDEKEGGAGGGRVSIGPIRCVSVIPMCCVCSSGLLPAGYLGGLPAPPKERRLADS